MKHLKLFENFEEDEYLDSIEDYLVEWLDSREAQLVSSNEWIRVYTFKNEELADLAKARLVRMGQPGWRGRYIDKHAIVLFKPELEKVIDDKLLPDSEVPTSKGNFNIWKKDNKIIIKQCMEWAYIKWEDIWEVLDKKYSIDFIDARSLIMGWLRERYKIKVGIIQPI